VPASGLAIGRASRRQRVRALAFQTARTSGEPWVRTPLSVRIASVAATVSRRGNTRLSFAKRPSVAEISHQGRDSDESSAEHGPS
jgi:hypothetical protein